MRLTAAIADYQREVELRDSGESVSAEVADKHYELDVRESADGYLIVSDGKIFDCRVEGRPESGQPVVVTVGTQSYAITLTDPKRLRGAASMAAQADKAARIVAPMPGKVVRVLLEVGDQVEVGAGVVVVEAMKMQNEMKSPMAGTLVTLNVLAGTTVNAGDVLAVIE